MARMEAGASRVLGRHLPGRRLVEGAGARPVAPCRALLVGCSPFADVEPDEHVGLVVSVDAGDH